MSLMVVDASVAVKWILREPGDEAALALLSAYAANKLDLIAPRLLMEEVASAISKRCRRRVLSAAEGNAAYRTFALRHPRLVDSASQVNQALALSVRHHISFWDSIYLALAIDRKADLITADRRFHRAAGRHYPFTKLLGRSLI